MKKTKGAASSLSVSSRPARPWVVIGNPGNRRIALFQEGLRELGVPPARVISYRDCLEGNVDLDGVIRALAAERGILRIESPGEDHAVERLLIARGASEGKSGGISSANARRMRPDHGRVRHPRQWFAGYSAL